MSAGDEFRRAEPRWLAPVRFALAGFCGQVEVRFRSRAGAGDVAPFVKCAFAAKEEVSAPSRLTEESYANVAAT